MEREQLWTGIEETHGGAIDLEAFDWMLHKHKATRDLDIFIPATTVPSDLWTLNAKHWN